MLSAEIVVQERWLAKENVQERALVGMVCGFERVPSLPQEKQSH